MLNTQVVGLLEDIKMGKVYRIDFLKIGVILIILSCTSSCGQKGPLYYPDKDKASSLDSHNIT